MRLFSREKNDKSSDVSLLIKQVLNKIRLQEQEIESYPCLSNAENPRNFAEVMRNDFSRELSNT